MKFKIGDKVKILPLTLSVSVEPENIGKIGVITGISPHPSNSWGITVFMDKICKARGYKCKWSVGTNMIELQYAKGTQLLFEFMD